MNNLIALDACTWAEQDRHIFDKNGGRQKAERHLFLNHYLAL